MLIQHRLCCYASLLVLAALWPAASLAMPITVVAQTRNVSVETTHFSGGLDSDFAGAADSLPFDALVHASSGNAIDPEWTWAIASASQSSTIGASDIELTSRIEGWLGLLPAGTTAFAQSTFDVTFDLLVDSNYTVSNYLQLHEFNQTQNAHLYDDQGNILLEIPLSSSFSDAGPLAAGRYRLELITSVINSPRTYDGIVTQQFSMQFAPVPETSTGLLLAVGLVGIAARRSRRAWLPVSASRLDSRQARRRSRTRTSCRSDPSASLRAGAGSR